MAADLIVYCLEKLSDYAQFERLCHDVMAHQGYPHIEPLGAFKDKGRDAVHVARATGRTTVFAYSVQDDWKKKVESDARKLKKHGHACDELVFLFTGTPTAGERDAVKQKIAAQFGFDLELYGLERLRTCLAHHRHIVHAHPHIFPPDVIRGALSFTDATPKDHVFLGFAPADEALATWLTRRLTAEGYRVWCRSLRLLGEEAYPNDVDGAIRHGTHAMVALLSRESLADPDFAQQRGLALNLGDERDRDMLIPVAVEDLAGCRLDRRTERLGAIPFEDGWAEGLALLVKKLRQAGCPRPLDDGRAVAANSFLGRDVIGGAETVYSNWLRVRSLPEAIAVFAAERPIPPDRLAPLRSSWAFRPVSETRFLAFHRPPDAIASEFGVALEGERRWREHAECEGIDSSNLASELVRKSLNVRCIEKGLRFCPETFLHYFPPGLVEKDKIWFTLPSGVATWKQVVGERTFPRGAHRDRFRYSVAPGFSVRRDLGEAFIVLVRIRVRLTDPNGRVPPKRAGQARRKKLCKNWWNDDWMNLTLAVCEFLSEPDGNIAIGDGVGDPIVVSGAVRSWPVPVGVDEHALGQSSFDRNDVPLGGDPDDADGADEDGEGGDD